MVATHVAGAAGAIALVLLSGCEPPGDDAITETQAALVATVSFTDTHVNANSWGQPGCGGFTRHLWGQEPASGGPYPVFVYFVGFGGSYTAVDAKKAVTEMAGRGFVAASVEYTNGIFDGLDCPTTLNKTSCAFNPTAPTSAIYKLCHRAKADCSKGIVAAGHSLGGGVVILAKSYDARVQAVWTIGAGSSSSSTACLQPQNRALPPSRQLALAGQADPNTGIAELNGVTGLSCPTGSTQCPVAAGASFPTAGWYQVQSSEVADGTADHCYEVAGGCSTSPTALDANWAPPAAYAWSLGPTLDWLTQFVTR
jgi:hypothetical protein